MTIINKYPNDKKIDEVIKYFEIGDEQNMSYAIENLFDEVIEDAKKEGIEQGIEQAKFDMAKKLLEKGMDVSEIAEITGLTEKDIAEIKK